jgi:hypothetical protein
LIPTNASQNWTKTNVENAIVIQVNVLDDVVPEHALEEVTGG